MKNKKRSISNNNSDIISLSTLDVRPSSVDSECRDGDRDYIISILESRDVTHQVGIAAINNTTGRLSLTQVSHYLQKFRLY